MTADDRLSRTLRDAGHVAVAVSGGVDSMTLAFLAHHALGRDALMVHAVSPAVPAEATERVHRYVAREGWTLRVIDAGEFDDPDYLANPVNRCFFCKKNLYGAIATVTDRPIVSGTNTDDLGDYRPGLEAARERRVRHPYVEAGIDKDGVRAIAAARGLDDLAELPAAPCQPGGDRVVRHASTHAARGDRRAADPTRARRGDDPGTGAALGD